MRTSSHIKHGGIHAGCAGQRGHQTHFRTSRFLGHHAVHQNPKGNSESQTQNVTRVGSIRSVKNSFGDLVSHLRDDGLLGGKLIYAQAVILQYPPAADEHVVVHLIALGRGRQADQCRHDQHEAHDADREDSKRPRLNKRQT